MRRLLALLLLIPVACADASDTPDLASGDWVERARETTIIRDEWGIPHIYGATDADAIFGMMYAQAEDDFNRIETNFLNSMGHLAEAEGEDEIWRDLRMRLFIDPVEMQALYDEAPEWMRNLMDAWAAGLNHYIDTHPETPPRVIQRFEPWMALSFSEGSIGGDIERVSLGQLEDFYTNLESGGAQGEAARSPDAEGAAGPSAGAELVPDGFVAAGIGAAPSRADPAPASGLVFPEEPTGSNGFAIAPANTVDGNALLLINPHTSFYFRHEAHVVSEEGLNAYGASTWGQFFIYQGFNETVGWMHTSSGVDNIDEYLETIVEEDGGLFYRYGEELRPVTQRETTIRYRTEDGGMAERTFTVYRTHHGPIVREADGRWVSVALMEDPLNALIQSYIRTKAANYDEYIESMALHTNSSNNTVFADADGNIAYLHSNFIPRRDESFDWTRPVDGSDPATDWQGVLSIDESPNAINPPNGWVQNTNNWPFTAAGANSPRQEDFPSYVQRGGENARGVHALMVLEGRTDFTLDGLMEAAYDSYLPAFAESIPPLLAAWDGLAASDPLRAQLAEQIELLRGWDYRFSVESVPTALAIFWAGAARGRGAGDAATAEPGALLEALADATAELEEDFGSWRTPWGEINRFQRLTGDIQPTFDDAQPSIPVAFPSATWGSLASYGARAYPNTNRWYGTSGNSFVAVVEFGDRLRARAVTAGGLNNVPGTPHFNDQAERYATGDLREVHFYREDVEANAERTYSPGG